MVAGVVGRMVGRIVMIGCRHPGIVSKGSLLCGGSQDLNMDFPVMIFRQKLLGLS